MKRVSALLLTLLMALTLVACGNKSSGSEAANPAETPAASGDTIKIGYVSDLTGATALWGTAGQYGAELAIKEINDAGGVLDSKMLELVPMDGKGEAADSVSAFKNLVEVHHIVASVGTNFSSCNIPMASVADEVKVPILGTAASNELVTVDENGNLHPYSFRMCFIDSYLGTVVGNYAYDTLGVKSAALFTVAGNTNSESVGQFIKDAFTAKGGTIVADEQCQEGDVDFRAQLANIGSANPEIVFVIMNDYAKIATFAKQAREMGIDCVMMGHDGWDSAQLAKEAEGALEGCLYVSRIGFSTPEARAFGERVVKEYNTSMEAECLFGHDGVMWVADAIERAGSADPVAIRDALEQTDVFEGLIGTLVMDPATHNPSMACAVYQCEGDVFNFTQIVEAQ
ncbi:MAG: ABC transporter substrate-binding protein [Clostridiales bacterium]|nr:ABC transporter substrate-binding protein [Clostridiales bacterium]